MSNTGFTLQLGNKTNVLGDAHLLIVTDNGACAQEIQQVLQAMTVRFQYHIVSSDRSLPALAEYQYDLILYNYSKGKKSIGYVDSFSNANCKYPITELAWWYNSNPKIPLVLITEPLGDQLAIACVKSGISHYLLRNQLSDLPYILEQTLNNNTSLESDYLQQLLAQIKQLQIELSSLQKQNLALINAENNINKEYFSHLNHELRSPLANILQFARMLKEEIYGSLNTKQTEYISGILTSGNHLLELINDYLDMAKIDANSEELFKEKVAVEDICAASLVMVQGRAKAQGLKLILDIAKDIDFCYADSLRLKQILINLLSNAVKFTEQGSVTLQVRTTPQMLLFSVIDTGIGISQEDAAKLFKPFQQINTPIHRKHKSTGLGLALSRKIAQLHGGDIAFTSQPGKGSCFTLSLPRFS